MAGIKSWHMFHNCEYPASSEASVKKLLKASRIVELKFMEIEKKRPPVLISDLVHLANETDVSNDQSVVAMTIALVAFWGTARLGELVSDDPTKLLPTWEDVEWGPNGSYAKIAIFQAKTAGQSTS